MRVDVPIVDKTGETVAMFVWNGTLYEGDSWFEQVAATADQASAAQGAIEMNRFLKGVRIRSVGTKDWVRGWFGLEGMVGALRIALPAVGLSVGRFDPTDVGVEDVEQETPADLIE